MNQTTLVKKESIAEGILAFYFKKPEGFTFTPGQHATVWLLNPTYTDEEGDGRTFSFITTPSDELVGFATRLRNSAFKRTLQEAEGELDVELRNPRGSMVLPKSGTRPLIMLAGGIGITPFIGMIRQAQKEKPSYPIILFHSNKTLEQAPFFDELMEYSKKGNGFTFVPTFTQTAPENWTGETGYFTEELLRKYVSEFSNSVFFLAGPAGMVEPTMQLLETLGVDPLFIKSEDFGEYR